VRQSPAFVLSHVTILVTRAGKVIAIYLDRVTEAPVLANNNEGVVVDLIVSSEGEGKCWSATGTTRCEVNKEK